MELDKLFEDGQSRGLFSDFQICVVGRPGISFAGGPHVKAGARWFDTASLTKAVVHLVFLLWYHRNKIHPLHPLRRYLSVRELRSDERTLAHFLCGAVMGYGWNYDPSNEDEFAGDVGRLKEAILSRGFDKHLHEFKYENVASSYVGQVLERIYTADLAEVLQAEFVNGMSNPRFAFHPIARGVKGIRPSDVVPVQEDPLMRGRVHDKLSFQHEGENISVAGVFADAKTLAHATHRIVESFSPAFLSLIAENWLAKLGVHHHPTNEPYGLGFDKPRFNRFEGLDVEDALIYTGHTGGRLFFARKPRVTVAILTNHILFRTTKEKDAEYRTFCWDVLRQVVEMQG